MGGKRVEAAGVGIERGVEPSVRIRQVEPANGAFHLGQHHVEGEKGAQRLALRLAQPLAGQGARRDESGRDLVGVARASTHARGVDLGSDRFDERVGRRFVGVGQSFGDAGWKRMSSAERHLGSLARCRMPPQAVERVGQSRLVAEQARQPPRPRFMQSQRTRNGVEHSLVTEHGGKPRVRRERADQRMSVRNCARVGLCRVFVADRLDAGLPELRHLARALAEHRARAAETRGPAAMGEPVPRGGNGELGAQAHQAPRPVVGQEDARAQLLAGEVEERLGGLQDRRFQPVAVEGGEALPRGEDGVERHACGALGWKRAAAITRAPTAPPPTRPYSAAAANSSSSCRRKPPDWRAQSRE